jgi:hypothetical protein
MKFSGQFRITLPDGSEQIWKNRTTDQGEQEYLRMLFRNDMTQVPSGFYVGLCDQSPAESDDLSGLSTEPAAETGYARINLLRNSTDWPTIQLVNGRGCVVSKEITFTNSGVGDWTQGFSRAFLCNHLDSILVTDTLFAYTGGLTAPVILQPAADFKMKYEIYID